MVDNVNVTPGTGATIATDDVGGFHYQKVKVALGAENAVDVMLDSGQQTSANSVPVVLPSDAADVKVTLDSEVVPVAGDVAHDTGDSGNPVKIGYTAVAFGATPTAVTAADRVRAIANLAGIPFALGGHPNLQSIEYYTTGAATDDNLMAVFATGTKIIITQITVAVSAACTVSPSVRIGFGTSTIPAQGATGADGVANVILSHPGIPPGGGVVKGNGSGIVGVGADDAELRITCTAPTTGALTVQVDYFAIAS